MSLTMDKISGHLESLAKRLAMANKRLDTLKEQKDIDDDKLNAELEVIQEHIRDIVNDFNNLRTVATGENWKHLAQADSVTLPEDKK